MCSTIDRRSFVRLNLYGAAFVAASGLTQSACSRRLKAAGAPGLVVLGLDGMDPRRIMRLMDEGRMPTFKRVARAGYFGPLGTTSPPQSPVAWASFISGCNPGGHGIFDFIHRNPEDYSPYLSTSRILPSESSLHLGKYNIPLGSGTMENLRRGLALWDVLADHGVPATIFKMPSNFPPSQSAQRCLSGLGTPDLLGSYGMFSYYTDDPFVMLDSDIGGGTVRQVELRNDGLQSVISGPPNGFVDGSPDTEVDFKVYRAADCDAARIDINGQELLLNQGEWSQWVGLDFPMAPGVSAHGMCQFFLKEVHPTFKLYVTPINIDPRDPALPISTPEDYAAELAEAIGPFHTKGLPSDTKALDQGIFDDGDFLAQDQIHLEESLAALEYELKRFEGGLLFFYLSNIDQRSHMFWRLTDPKHPAYDEKLAKAYGSVIDSSYVEMDRLLDSVLSKIDAGTRVLALSDHGFHGYSRSFNLNSWLMENGYLKLQARVDRNEMHLLSGVDWSSTTAYAFGFNGICINQRGREGQGIVSAEATDALVSEIAAKLEKTVDPMTRSRVVRTAALSRQVYSGPYVGLAPEIVVGYDHGYRCSWQTALGMAPSDLLTTNDHKWSGDHLMDASISPGMLLTDLPINGQGLALQDVTGVILSHFGVPVPEEMDAGRRPGLNRISSWSQR